MRSDTTPTTSYKTGGAAGDLDAPADPTRMTVPLTGTDLNLTPFSQALRKASYRGIRQVEPVLPQRAVDSTPNFGNRPPSSALLSPSAMCMVGCLVGLGGSGEEGYAQEWGFAVGGSC